MLIRPVQKLLDRGVRFSTTAEALCERLENRTLQIRPGPDEWCLYFRVENGRLLLRHGQADKPDAVISGSLVNLARLGSDDPEAVIREGRVKITGDAQTADEFRTLLDLVRPDWEEELARIIGDPLAHEAGRAFKGFSAWGQRARRSFGRSLAEFLTEESRDLAAAAEIEEFCADVDELALGVERAEASLQRLKAQLGKRAKVEE
jgi:ubiquinone biosynthesis protein UbiJ